MAFAYQELKEFNKAIQYYKDVILKDPKNEEAYQNLGIIY
jgi:tetratricopeptide (TPR) repeat protein